jgi:nucleotide-binding universal stress UspA family protein
MKSNKYKILILSDLKESVNETLNYATSLSKEIDADIEFFHVKSAIEIIETDSPLTAMRTISEVCIQTEKKIKKLVTPISKEHDVNIKVTFGYGNVKNEIENCITTSQPDVVVLGKRKRKLFSFVGDNITDFVIKKYDGIVLIAEEADNFMFDKVSLTSELEDKLIA